MARDKQEYPTIIGDVAPRILRLKEVMQLTGLSRTGIYERIKNGGFPQQVNLGGRSIGFVDIEVREWIAGRIRNRKSA